MATMSFDGIVIRALVHELQQLLVGGRINKIHQPQPTDLLFLVRAGGNNHKLLISANLSFPRVYITDENFVNPLEPPMFTMLLRKHLEGGVIQRIAQVDLERIIHIDVTKRDELEELRVIRLVIEIMGRHSNVILVDPDRNMILDGLHHVTPSISSYRQVLPGRPYLSPPPQNKLNPLEVDKSTFLSTLSYNEGKLEKQIVDHFLGISPLIAKEILHRANLPTQDGLWEAFHEIMESVKNNRYSPNIVSGVKSIFSVIPITHLEGERKSFNSVNECLKSYYETKAANELIRQMANDLLHILNQEKSKYVKKLEKLNETIADAEKAEKFKLWGELITAFQYQLKAGDKVACLPNYYEEGEPTIEIPLDPALTPNENAQIYFKKYNKAKNSLNVVSEQLEKTKEEIAYLEQVIAQIEIADQKHLEEIREELAE
jgi:predicted ribosome quality control (RQC) complex YloA/Tae2 family protein